MAVNEDPAVRVYWAPGCTSCLRTKEFLRRHGVEFDSINVRSRSGAMDELRSLGARSVPIVARGDRFVYSQSLADVREFLGMPSEQERALSAEELAQRIDLILAAALRYVRQMPDAMLDRPFRNSWAPPRGLAHHVFRIVEAFLEATDNREPLTYELIMLGTHDVAPGDDVAFYGDAIRERFRAWWERNRGVDTSTTMPTYYGEQSLLATLERTTWHSAQHTRQLMVVLEANKIEVDGPLTSEDLQGLPLPEKAWDDDA
jgi:glutaredoxin